VIDRRNRRDLTIFGLILMGAGGLSAALGGGVFGDHRANEDVFDRTLIRWWDEGGWESFAVVTAIGLVAVIAGAALVARQLHRNDGRDRAPNVTFPTSQRGETTLRSTALSHSLETDLKSIPDVTKALVGLFGRYPNLEMRAVLTVGDGVDLDSLPARVDEVLERSQTTVGVRPQPIQISIRFKTAEPDRQLV
jgi:hypothetical protein